MRKNEKMFSLISLISVCVIFLIFIVTMFVPMFSIAGADLKLFGNDPTSVLEMIMNDFVPFDSDTKAIMFFNFNVFMSLTVFVAYATFMVIGLVIEILKFVRGKELSPNRLLALGCGLGLAFIAQFYAFSRYALTYAIGSILMMINFVLAICLIYVLPLFHNMHVSSAHIVSCVIKVVSAVVLAAVALYAFKSFYEITYYNTGISGKETVTYDVGQFEISVLVSMLYGKDVAKFLLLFLAYLFSLITILFLPAVEVNASMKRRKNVVEHTEPNRTKNMIVGCIVSLVLVVLSFLFTKSAVSADEFKFTKSMILALVGIVSVLILTIVNIKFERNQE